MTGAPYIIARAVKLQLEREAESASRAWNAIPGVGAGALGLTADSVKQSPEYRRARLAYDAAVRAVRDYNRAFMREHGRQYCADLRRERAAAYQTREAAE